MVLIEPFFPRARFTSPAGRGRIALAIRVRGYALSMDLNPSLELPSSSSGGALRRPVGNSTSPKGEVKCARDFGSTLIMLS
jgi:hypothetical protein